MKLTIGHPFTFEWYVPGGAVTMVAESATLTISWPGGASTYTLALAHKPDDITAGAGGISADRKRLALEWNDGPLTKMGRVPEPAVVTDGANIQIPVSVTRTEDVDGSAGYAYLADALPFAVVPDNAVLYWPRFSVVVPSIDIGSTPIRVVKWAVAYSPVRNGVTLSETREFGTFAVVRMPFATGLRDQDVQRFYPSIGMPPTGVAGWEHARTLALDELAGRLIKAGALRDSGASIDALEGSQFLRLHGLLTVRQILVDRHIGGRDQTQALAFLDAQIEAAEIAALASIVWLDANDDGVVDDGETGQAAGVSVGSIGTSSAALVDIDDPTDAVSLERISVAGDR